MGRLVRAIRAQGEHFILHTKDGPIKLFIKLEYYREHPRPSVSFDLPDSVHMERLDS